MMNQSQAQQLPSLSQSQAQLSSSLWQPGQDAPRTITTVESLSTKELLTMCMQTRSRYWSR